jgi:outer membrane protein assembly factor BamB
LRFPWSAEQSDRQVTQVEEAEGGTKWALPVDTAGQPNGPAFTGAWRHADALESSPLTNLPTMGIPGVAGSPKRLPFVRIGVCIASDKLSPNASSSQFGAQFLGFLCREPVAQLIMALTGASARQTWTRLAGDGPFCLEAVVDAGRLDGNPRASAVLELPSRKNAARSSGDMACLWLHAESHAPGDAPPQPAGLAEWHERFSWAISLADALAWFLTAQLGLPTRNTPSARAGVLLQAPSSVTDLVAVGDLRQLPGAAPADRFLGTVVADRDGKPTSGIADELLTQLCDHTLHLRDFEPVIAALNPASRVPVPGPLVARSSRPRNRGGRRLLLAFIAAILATATIGWLTAASLVSGSRPTSSRAVELARASIWVYRTAGGINCTPAHANGTIYIGDDNGWVYALTAVTGQLRWKHFIGGEVWSRPAVSDGMLYIGSTDHNVYALYAATGRVRWFYRAGGKVESGPAVADGIVYVGSGDGKVYALSALTGRVLWSHVSGPVQDNPVVADGVVYVGSGNHQVYALSAVTGRVLWTYPTRNGILSSPLVIGNTVYIGSLDGSVYALNASTGGVRWFYSTGTWIFFSGPVLASRTIYIANTKGMVYALDATTGHLRWKHDIGAKIQGSPAVSSGTVYIGSFDHDLYALNASTGAIRWAYPTGWGISASPIVVGNVVYIGSTYGTINAVNAKAG